MTEEIMYLSTMSSKPALVLHALIRAHKALRQPSAREQAIL